MRSRQVCAIVLLLTTAVMFEPLRAWQNERRVYVTVLDQDGRPIVGLTPEHFVVRESGRDRTVTKVDPLRIPMDVAVLVDTSIANGAPDEPFRSAVLAFLDRLASVNRVALYSFGDRAQRITDFTQDAAQLRTAATGMFGWSHQRTSFIDAIDLAARDFDKLESRRPVMIAISSENPEASGKTAGGVIKHLISQSIAFHSVTIATVPTSVGGSGVGAKIPEKSQRLGGMIAAGEGDRERNQMLQQGTAATGGGRQRITSTLALNAALGRVVGELANSFVITFERPGSAKMQNLEVGILVDGVSLRATAAPFDSK